MFKTATELSTRRRECGGSHEKSVRDATSRVNGTYLNCNCTADATGLDMRALAVRPGQSNSVRLVDVPEPSLADGALLVQALAMGVCGTDIEIVEGRYGWAPPGVDRLIIGHESLGRVVEAPDDSSLRAGDLVVGIVRRPDPVPCRYCAAGEWDMCRNGQYTERGIKERDGYGSERFRLEPSFAVKVDSRLGDTGVLLEPASVVAKAWDHAERIGRRSSAWAPRTVLVTGAGPIGLLAAMMGVQRGFEVHIYDRLTGGPKPDVARALGATYHGGGLSMIEALTPDIIIECTGATAVIADVVTRSAPRLEQLLEERQRLEARLQEALRTGGGSAMTGDRTTVDGVDLTIAETTSDDRAEVGRISDQFREGKRNGVLVLFSTGGRGGIHVALTDDLVRAGRNAGDLVNRIAALSGGRGGGRPHFASAGAGDATKLSQARAATRDLVSAWLGGARAEGNGA
jgi:threonine dehydrogenase-like Zn-dependent dehydrogenase